MYSSLRALFHYFIIIIYLSLSLHLCEHLRELEDHRGTYSPILSLCLSQPEPRNSQTSACGHTPHSFHNKMADHHTALASGGRDGISEVGYKVFGFLVLASPLGEGDLRLFPRVLGP